MMERSTMKKQLLQDIRQGRVQPERSGDYWSKDEREDLTFLYEAGEGLSQIALRLGRSEQAVVQQLIAMELFTPAGKTAFGRQSHLVACAASASTQSLSDPAWKKEASAPMLERGRAL